MGNKVVIAAGAVLALAVLFFLLTQPADFSDKGQDVSDTTQDTDDTTDQTPTVDEDDYLDDLEGDLEYLDEIPTIPDLDEDDYLDDLEQYLDDLE
jgi:hypothetical protein